MVNADHNFMAVSPKKWTPNSRQQLCQILSIFNRLVSKFVVSRLLHKIPPHLKCVGTLPCEIFLI